MAGIKIQYGRMFSLLLVFCLAVILNGCLYNTKQKINKPEVLNTTQNEFTVYQKITIDDKPQSSIGYITQAGQTALMLLKKTAIVKTKGEGQNAFVTEINGRMADDKKKEYWSFYVNDKPSSVGAGSYKLNPKDQIEWKIETY